MATMATAAVNLSVPAPADDSMEMSSPARHDLDDDIDFEDWQPEDAAKSANDTDRMMEDGEQTRPATATDDVMEDDVHQGEQTAVPEEEMQDSPSHVQQIEDEDLIDYSDDEELPDQVVEDAVAPAIIEQPQGTAPTDLPDGDVDEEIVREPDHAGFEPPAEDAAEATIPHEGGVPALPGTDGTATSQEAPVAVEITAEEGDQTHDDAVDADGQEPEEQNLGAGLEDPPVTDGDEAHRPAISLDTSGQTSADCPATPTDTGLHAMTLRFGDLQWPLFKSRNQPDGLLKNDNLASLSLGELIQDCRQRLASKTGDVLSEDQDLVLGFDQLGLMLAEDSRAAFECSLEEVLDVYLQLHQNDETEDIPPFSVNLSLRLKFTSSISVLKHAAAGGSGMTSFGFVRHGENEHTGEYDEEAATHAEDGEEEFDEAYVQEETAYGHEFELTAPIGGSIPEQQEADTNDQYGGYGEQQNEYLGQEGYFQEQEEHYGDELDQGHYDPENEEEVTHPHEAYDLEGEGDAEESADTVQDVQHAQIAAAEGFAPATLDASVTDKKTASTATSTTFQGDDGQDIADHNSTDQINYSTLLTEQEDEAKDGGDNRDSLKQDFARATGAHNDQAAEVSGLSGPEAQDFGSEDYLGNYEEQQSDEGHLGNGESYDAVPEDGHQTYGQEYEQTDDNDVQQDEAAHLNGRPGEDDQFSTAYELFDEADAHQHEPDDGAPSHDADATAAAPAAAAEKPTFDDDDFIDFDLDEEPPAVSMPKKANTAAAGSRTPLAKRSYEELADDDIIDFDSPEPKKARGS